MLRTNLSYKSKRDLKPDKGHSSKENYKIPHSKQAFGFYFQIITVGVLPCSLTEIAILSTFVTATAILPDFSGGVPFIHYIKIKCYLLQLQSKRVDKMQSRQSG